MHSREHPFDQHPRSGTTLERSSEPHVLLTPTARTARTDAKEIPVTSSPAVHGAVRLTRRGRLLLLAALVALLCAAFTLGRAGDSQASTDRSAPAVLASTTVHPGESLWAVAQRVAPGRDPRALVQQIREINDLSSATVQVGQLLLLPRVS